MGGCRQGKALFLSSTLKLKNMQQSRQYTSLSVLQPSAYESHLGGRLEAKEYFPHAVAPLTSYKWSKLHRYMKIVLCKISTEFFRYTSRLGQCCYSLFQAFQCPELSYFNVLCFIFLGTPESHFQISFCS